MNISESPTSINLIWTQPEGEVVDSYEVSFSYQGPCSGFNHTNTTTVDGTTRQYTLTGLQEFSNYTVTVVAVNDAGRSGGSSLNVVTMADGAYVCSYDILWLATHTVKTSWLFQLQSGYPVGCFNCRVVTLVAETVIMRGLLWYLRLIAKGSSRAAAQFILQP